MAKYNMPGLKAEIKERKKDTAALRRMNTGQRLSMKDSSRLARVTAEKNKPRNWSKLVKAR